MRWAPVLVLGLLAGCTGAGPDVRSQEANVPTSSASTSTTSTTVVSSSTTATTTSTTTSTTVDGPAAGDPSSRAASTVRTSGGDVTVRARDGRLEVVDVAAAPGWRSEQRLEEPGRLVVSFERDGGRVDVTVELTPTGIATTTRTVATD